MKHTDKHTIVNTNNRFISKTAYANGCASISFRLGERDTDIGILLKPYGMNIKGLDLLKSQVVYVQQSSASVLVVTPEDSFHMPRNKATGIPMLATNEARREFFRRTGLLWLYSRLWVNFNYIRRITHYELFSDPEHFDLESSYITISLRLDALAVSQENRDIRKFKAYPPRSFPDQTPQRDEVTLNGRAIHAMRGLLTKGEVVKGEGYIITEYTIDLDKLDKDRHKVLPVCDREDV